MSNRISLDTLGEVNLFLTAAEGSVVEVENASHVEGKPGQPGIQIFGELERTEDDGGWFVRQSESGYGINFWLQHVAYAEKLAGGRVLIVLK